VASPVSHLAVDSIGHGDSESFGSPMRGLAAANGFGQTAALNWPTALSHVLLDKRSGSSCGKIFGAGVDLIQISNLNLETAKGGSK
jgi:hypothetical protein